MPAPRFTLAALAALVLAGSARADICNQATLHGLAMPRPGVLEVQAEGQVARSADDGKTWRIERAAPGVPRPFVGRRFEDGRGIVYQNVVFDRDSPRAIRSRDHGAIWEDAQFPGQQTLVVWADQSGVYEFSDNALGYLGMDGGIGQGWFAARQGPTPLFDYEHDVASGHFDGRHFEISFGAGHEGQPIVPVDLGGGARLTGFFVTPDRTIYIGTTQGIVRGFDMGSRWETIPIPPEWRGCRGSTTSVPPPRPRAAGSIR